MREAKVASWSHKPALVGSIPAPAIVARLIERVTSKQTRGPQVRVLPTFLL